MVKIETIKTYAPSRLKRAAKSGSQSTFSVSGEGAGSAQTTATNAPQSAAEMASLSQLMQIQEVSERDASTKRTVSQGEMILESLEKLQNENLAGAVSKRSLEHIVSVTTSLPAQIADPNLKQVIAEIKQRAMVEIAKIEMGR